MGGVWVWVVVAVVVVGVREVAGAMGPVAVVVAAKVGVGVGWRGRRGSGVGFEVPHKGRLPAWVAVAVGRMGYGGSVQVGVEAVVEGEEQIRSGNCFGAVAWFGSRCFGRAEWVIELTLD